MATFLLIVKIVAITLGAIATVFVLGGLALFLLITSGEGNPFR